MTKFSHASKTTAEGALIELTGVLDEDVDLAAIFEDVEASALVIDLAGVERITSEAGDAWDETIAALGERDVAVRLRRCSAAMVFHLNRRREPNCTIESVALPYFCPECDESRTLYAAASDLARPPVEAPVRRCEECDFVMQFDDDATYFGFLGAAAPAPTPPRLATAPALAPSRTLLLITVVLVLAGLAGLAVHFS